MTIQLPRTEFTPGPATVDGLSGLVPKEDRRRRDAATPTVSKYEVQTALRNEFYYADFGDKRLTDRLQQIGGTLGRLPNESIPHACGDWASTKGTYRFCDNDTVDPTEITASHAQAQGERLRDVDELLVIGDTTTLTFPSHSAKEGLGDIGTSETDIEGVKLHSSIGVNTEQTDMTGVLDQQALIQYQDAEETYDSNGRGESVALESEQDKWVRGERHARDALPDHVRPIFVHDRGADAFPYYRAHTTDLADTGFIVRASHNRRIYTPTGDESQLFDWAEELPEVNRQTIELQQSGDREYREAEVAISAGTCELRPPTNASDTGEPIEVNVVRVDEVGRPDDDAIEWVLLTSEPVDTVEEVMTVIEYYEARWRIEEWHQVLKSGCRIEERQLETWERMETIMRIYSVIAWKVLSLRTLARGNQHSPPDAFLTETERTILETKYPELEGGTGKAYAVAVAKLGGYLDRGSDPPPGWETMWRGVRQLRMWAEGYNMGSA